MPLSKDNNTIKGIKKTRSMTERYQSWSRDVSDR